MRRRTRKKAKLTALVAPCNASNLDLTLNFMLNFTSPPHSSRFCRRTRFCARTAAAPWRRPPKRSASRIARSICLPASGLSPVSITSRMSMLTLPAQGLDTPLQGRVHTLPRQLSRLVPSHRPDARRFAETRVSAGIGGQGMRASSVNSTRAKRKPVYTKFRTPPFLLIFQSTYPSQQI